MSHVHDIAAALHDPRLLEEMYRKAVQAGEGGAWSAEVARLYAQTPDHALLAAWHYRLQPGAVAETPAATARLWRTHWQLAVPLGLLLGVVYWFLTNSDMMLTNDRPYLFFLWAPLAAMAIITFVAWPAVAARKPAPWTATFQGRLCSPGGLAVVVVVAEFALAAYSVWLATTAHAHYQDIVMLHLPIVALIAVGLVVAGPGSDDRNRFAFLIKATEAVVTGGIIGGASMAFLAITFGIFDAIGVTFPDALARAMVACAAGLVVLLAVAVVYDARFAPLEQRFEDGMSKLISTLGRFFLPLTLIVAVAYVASIPFNFWRPFEQRDVLIVYNAMLFAVMGLLVFATPVATASVGPGMWRWLRWGIVAVAALALLVSLYALSATVYRTAQGGLTINRLTIIGWNVINMFILAHMLNGQRRTAAADWPAAIYRSCRIGAIAYALWTVFLLLALPWLFPL